VKLVRFECPVRGVPMSGTLEGETVLAAEAEYALDGVKLLPPCEPTKIVCVAKNYAAHAAEMGGDVPERPSLFLKPPSAVVGPEGAIVMPEGIDLDYEAELAVVIKERCRRVSARDAESVVLGYTCMNDVTDRQAQSWERNWIRAKAFDTSAPLGPWIVSPDELPSPTRVTLRLNGELRQDGSTAALIFDVPRLIETVTAFMTLERGDVIATGTPSGVGRLSAGDTVEVAIEGIGVLRNHVVREGGEKG
jgi:2-keto-4-pentenoate hydratase/2-oxohepta-3-ene-1,7-dioic acid hydratase in catechol pathway